MAEIINDPDVIKAKFEDYVKKMKEGEIKESRNEWMMAGKTEAHSIKSLASSKGLYETVTRTQNEYNKFNQEIALPLAQEKEDLKAYIGSYKTLYADLSKGLQDACVAIKEINKKVVAVKNAANQLEQDVKDTCNQKDANDLDSKLDANKDFNPDKKKGSFSLYVKNLHDQADYSLQDTVEIFNASVKVAGLTALLNLEGLEASFTEVGDQVDGLSKDVTENIKAVTEIVAKQTAEYEVAIKANQKALDENIQKGITYGANIDVIDFIENNTDKQRNKKTQSIDTLQKKINQALMGLWETTPEEPTSTAPADTPAEPPKTKDSEKKQ